MTSPFASGISFDFTCAFALRKKSVLEAKTMKNTSATDTRAAKIPFRIK